MSSRSSKIAPIEVQDILQESASIAAKPSPVEHVASPNSPAPSIGSSGRASFQSHSRPLSLINDSSSGVLRSNRFSLSFPVQPSGASSPVRTAQSPSREAQPVAPDSVPSPTGPTDTNFLTAIATQERRVLELKEELLRAEADLSKLKRQWAQHEAKKKKNDARSVTQLQPLQTTLPAMDREEDGDGSSAWMQQEMERRKALLNGQKSSSRTVFSGSKHTRTLSLLSPINRGPPSSTATSAQAPGQLPTRQGSLSRPARPSQDAAESQVRPTRITRASTTPDLTAESTDSNDQELDLVERAMKGDVFISTGKKMATDFRDGLWTFWEDLRQATVGDEGAQVLPPPRRQSSTQTLRTAKKQSSKNSLRPSSRGSSTASKASTDTKKPSPARKKNKSVTMSLTSAPALADPSFWTEHGILPDQQATPATVKKSSAKHAKSPSKAMSAASSDAWETWEDSSPAASRSSSAESETATLPSTVSGGTSPRMSTDAQSTERPTKRTSGPARKDPIPWPALSNLGPKALRRTASHLMSEWERSLTPSPSKEHANQSDYLGLGAEAAAAAVPSDRKKD